MVDPQGTDISLRLVILAPVGRDAELLERVAFSESLPSITCRTIEQFCSTFSQGLGAAVITEEALYLHDAMRLFMAVEQQPAWSEVPFIVLASRTNPEERVRKTFELTRPLLNVTLIERPTRPATLINAFQAALSNRRRQYLVRDTLQELEESKTRLEQFNAELEQRVEERTARLQLAVRELEGFTYSVSHDMRAPARAIISHARMVLEDYGDELSTGAEEHLEKLANAASKMGALVDDLLKYARLGDRKPRRTTFDLGELVQQVAHAATEDTECPVKLKVEPNLVIDADPELIKLALYNLIHNSCKYRANRDVEIEVGRQRRGGITAYYLKDNGIGFESQYAHKLFRPFERLHRDQDYPGTGIGLANVKRVIQLHGGDVWAQGDIGKGATFYFTLEPVAPEESLIKEIIGTLQPHSQDVEVL
jgi:signal transduction histidine kinase